MRVEGSSSTTYETVTRLHEKSRGSARQAAAVPQAGDSISSSGGTGDHEQSPGVIRLIQEGHFRGVADVRLRINFADTLQGIEAARTGDALDAGLRELQGALNGAVDEFVEGSALTEAEVAALEAARQAFNERIGGFLAEDGVGGAPVAEVFAELQTAFEDFLNALVPPQESSDAAVLPVAEASSTDASGGVFSELRDTLAKIFEEALTALQDGLGAAAPPPISEPQGNGHAFEKFLALYHELYGNGAETAPQEETLNTVT
jgi:hypothetical protein